MDVLSELIGLARLRPAVDVHCLLGGRFSVGHEPTSRGVMPFHLVLGGECVIELEGGRRVELQSGDILLLTRGSAHSIVNRHPSGATTNLVIEAGPLMQRRTVGVAADVDLLCGHFDYDAKASGLLLDTLPDVVRVSLTGQQSDVRLASIVGILKDETARDLPGSLTIMASMSLALLAMALRNAGPDVAGLPGLMKDFRLSKAVSAMLQDASRPWTLEELADISAISRATFARHFRAASGMTVGEFLTEFRMTKAADLLTRGSYPVAEVAEAVGYDSEAAFGRAFRRSRGTTPSKFRHSAAGSRS
ncbi:MULTISPECIES: AraC family transcriptional regulator [unclassified Rhizobium]|uniref:AraC family transcriptional regulator n=1 Tax=unclassified Rhizobium TaxID=2613769 RepID=UPI001ADA9EA0|nr:MULTISPECIES: AraC family transcriptional regulator [unclassified Rhizobium]MBO9127940.1 cupin domain-containing protein [Rhizobium sp. 16-488-2b]MBO9178517.1 cupin domain-containing protein [Rhizobium sp. 16-488-2a]